MNLMLLIGGVPVRMAVYYRVSSAKQSVAHQEAAVENWIRDQGYRPSSIIRFADEGVSGSKGQLARRGYASLLKAVLAGSLDRVLLFETSRASRDFLEYLRFLDVCQKCHCEVEVIGKGLQNFATSQDMLMASIHAFLAHAEREKISERTKSGLRKAKADGVVLGAPKGHKRHEGWRKEHSEELLAAIKGLVRKGLSNRAIAEVLANKYTPKPISYCTVRNLRLRYDLG